LANRSRRNADSVHDIFMDSITKPLEKVFGDRNAATSRLSAILDGLAARSSEKLDWRDSIVDLMKLLGMDSSLANREQLATALRFFGDFSDKAMMHIFLHNRIIMKIVLNHAVEVVEILDGLAAKKPERHVVAVLDGIAPRNSEVLDWRNSVVDLMKLFDMRSSLEDRIQLASQLGFGLELSGSGTMNMWLHARLIISIVDRGGTLPDDLAPRPERTPKQRVESLCRSLKTKDLLVPALAAIWERRTSGKPSRNDFEKHLYSIFNGLNAEEREGLGNAFDGFSALRMNGNGECLFSNHLADKVRNAPLENKDFAAAGLGQGLALTLKHDFIQAGGVPGRGQVRPWKKPFDIEGPADLGPWPWISKIHYGNNLYWFGNIESVIPEPPAQTHVWKEHQFEQVCRFTPVPTGGIDQRCDRLVMQPPPPPPGGMQFPDTPDCPGGKNYKTVKNECLRIPARQAGDPIWLSGFNFIDDRVNVHLQSMDVPTRKSDIKDLLVFGDKERPVKNEQGQVIVDHKVNDYIVVPLPTRFPEGSESPFPPGLYEIWISVNDPSAPPNAPIVRESNRLVLRIEPDPNTIFDLECEGGRCIKETPGTLLSDDEVSWTAFVGHLIPNDEQTGKRRAITEKVQFNRRPWEDVVDNKEVSSPTKIFPTDAELAAGHLGFKVGGVRFISILGFEVDSEVAARKQIHGFSDAFTKIMVDLATSSTDFLDEQTDLGTAVLSALESASGSTGSAAAATLLATGQYMMAAWAAAIVASVASLWAAWAPADMIALDLFALNARECFDRTDAGKILPPDIVRRFRDEFDDTDVLVSVTERPLKKIPQPETVGSVATWRHEVQYDTRHDGDEFSSYLLRFRLTRRVVGLPP
jgi:uncharacterized protein DUF3597